MANEPIDRSIIKLGAFKNSAWAPDTTNSAPPKKFRSSSSPTAEKEGGKLNRLSRYKTATLYPPLGQFFFNMILQIAMFASAIAFGVKSIDIAKTANEYSASANSFSARALEEARVANQLSMLAVCLQAGDVKNGSFATFCLRVLHDAPIVMLDAASNLFTRLSTATTSTPTISATYYRFLKLTATAPEFYPTHSMQTTFTFQPTQDPSRMASPPVCPAVWGRYILPDNTCPIPQVVSAPEVGDQLSRGPAPSNTGDNQKKTLAIALPLFFFFVVALLVIGRLKLRPKRSGPAPSCVSGVNVKGEEQGDGAGQGDGVAKGDDVAQRYVEEQGDGQGYVADQKKNKLARDWWKTFRVHFLDSTVSAN